MVVTISLFTFLRAVTKKTEKSRKKKSYAGARTSRLRKIDADSLTSALGPPALVIRQKKNVISGFSVAVQLHHAATMSVQYRKLFLIQTSYSSCKLSRVHGSSSRKFVQTKTKVN